MAEKYVGGGAGSVRGQRDGGEVCSKSYRLVHGYGGSGITSVISFELHVVCNKDEQVNKRRQAGVPIMLADDIVVCSESRE